MIWVQALSSSICARCDRLVALDHRVEEVEFAAAQAFEGLDDLGLRQPAHVEDATASFLEFDVVLPESVFGHVRHDPVREARRLTGDC